MGPSLVPILWIVVSSVAYAALDLLRKLLVAGIRPVPLLFYLSVGQLPFLLVWLERSPAFELGAGYWLPGLASVALNIAANLAFLQAVRRSPLSLTIPLLSLTPVFTTLLAVPILGEVPSPVQVAGIVLVVAGAFRLNLESGESGAPAALWRAFRREPGSLLMAVVALCWSLAAPLDKLAMPQASVPFHALVLNAGVGLGVLAVLAGQRRLGELRVPVSTWAPLAAAVVASVIGIAFLLMAITAVWVGLVETLKRAIGSVLALLLGRWAFAEPVSANKLLAVALMSAGVALLVL